MIIKVISEEEYEKTDTDEWFIDGKISDKPKSWERIVEEWAEECKKAGSNLKMPLLARIETPLCAICKNADFHIGELDEPECAAKHKGIPNEILACRIYKCSSFIFDSESKDVSMFSRKEIEEIIEGNSIFAD